MSKFVRRIIAATVGLALALGISACGNNKQTEAEQTSPQTVSQDSKTEPTQNSENSELTGEFEIAAFVTGEGREIWWNEVIEDFKNAYPKLEVKATLSGVIGDEIRPRWVSNNPPDFIYYTGESATKDNQQLIKEGRFEKLDEWLKTAKSYEDPNKLLTDVISVKNRGYDLDGNIIGMPISTGSYGLFYDAKLARDNGWTDMPTNWEDFIALCDKIKNSGKNIAPIAYPGKNAMGYLTNYILYKVALAEPDTYIDGINIVPGTWTKPIYTDSFKKFLKLRDYELNGSIGAMHTESQIAFLQRKAFFYPCGTWLEGEMAKDVPEDFEMQVIPFPLNEKGQKSITQTYASVELMITKDAKNKEAAKEFLRFMYQSKYAKRYAELVMENFAMNVDLTGVKTAPSVISFSKMLLDPNLTVFQTKIGRNPTQFVDLNNIYFSEQNKAWAGKITVEDFFKSFEEECRKYEKTDGFKKNDDAFLVKP